MQRKMLQQAKVAANEANLDKVRSCVRLARKCAPVRKHEVMEIFDAVVIKTQEKEYDEERCFAR